MKTPKLIFTVILFLIAALFLPNYLQAANMEEPLPTESYGDITESNFWAKVVEIGQERSEADDAHYQDLTIVGKTGDYKDKEYKYKGFTDNISSKHRYQKGDRVLVSLIKSEEGESITITDKSRLPALYFLSFLFFAIVLAVARNHGLRALLSLGLTLAVVLGYIIPRILQGAEPLSTVVGSSVVIVIVSILIVYGWNKKSRLAISGMLIGIAITALLSLIFSAWASLTGNSVEEVMFIKNYVTANIDFSGLLLASFIVGSLGVLDDVAITQVSTALEISKTNDKLTAKEIYNKSMNIGTDHIASMINTLFLAYAGASFVLLLLFGLNKPPFDTLATILNNEMVATEIVRTLVGSIGLILTVPITTYLASRSYGSNK